MQDSELRNVREKLGSVLLWWDWDKIMSSGKGLKFCQVFLILSQIVKEILKRMPIFERNICCGYVQVVHRHKSCTYMKLHFSESMSTCKYE